MESKFVLWCSALSLGNYITHSGDDVCVYSDWILNCVSSIRAADLNLGESIVK